MRWQKFLWAAVPTAVLVMGCVKQRQPEVRPDPPEVVSAELPEVAAVRGLSRVVKNLGGLDASEQVKNKLTDFAKTSPRGKEPVAGLGKSLIDIVQGGVSLQQGVVARFDVGKDKKLTELYVVQFLNGPKSPLQGWKGWRYRSGIVPTKQLHADTALAGRLGPAATTNAEESIFVVLLAEGGK